MNELTFEQVSELVELLDVHQQTVESMAQEHNDLLRDSSQPDGITPSGDPADLAEIELVRTHESAAVGRDVRELRKIQDARLRIGSGGAGICIECGDEIGFERLQVQPAAARCVYCQDAHEHAHLFRPKRASGVFKSY